MNPQNTHSAILVGARGLQREARGFPAPGIYPIGVVGFGKLLTVASGTGASANWNWKFAIYNGAGSFLDGALAGSLGTVSVFPGSGLTASSYGIVYQVCQSDTSGNSSVALVISSASGGGVPSGFKFAGIVKQNGVDGSGYPLYDVYNESDVSYTTLLNLSGPISLSDSRARQFGQVGSNITPAIDGSIANVWYSTVDGKLKMDIAPEFPCVSSAPTFGVA